MSQVENRMDLVALCAVRTRGERWSGGLDPAAGGHRGPARFLHPPPPKAVSESRPAGAPEPEPLGSDAAVQARRIRVLLADDQALIRAGLALVLREEPDLEVVGEATNGLAAVELTRQLQPDVVLMDVSMPKVDGIEATRLVAAEWPRVKVIGLSMYGDEWHGLAMRQAGAVDFLDKIGSIVQIVAAIRKHGVVPRKQARLAGR